MAFTRGSRDPDQFRIVRTPCVYPDVPVFRVPMPSSMSIQKCELCALSVPIRVHIVFLPDRSQFAGIKQPDYPFRASDRRQPYLFSSSPSIDVFVEAVVEKVVAVANPSVGWTDPKR